MKSEIRLSSLTPVQQRVIAALAQGATVTTAAKVHNIDRTTIHYWCRSNHAFASALARAKEIHAETVRDGLRVLSQDALVALRLVLNDEKTTPAVRLRAALAVIKATAESEAATDFDLATQEALYSGVCEKVSQHFDSSVPALDFQHFSTDSTETTISQAQ